MRRQVDAGIDVVSDGEMSKISYATYIARPAVSGFDGDTPREPGQDLLEFPRLLKKLAESGATAKYRRPRCVGADRSEGSRSRSRRTCGICAAPSQRAADRGFMNAASPGVIALFQPNDFYPTQDEYLEALAEAMRTEYEAIVAAGILLQIDCAGSRHGPAHACTSSAASRNS